MSGLRAPSVKGLTFVALVLDSRRFHALARQMRSNIDWQDGGIGWDGPEILPADDLEPVGVG